MPTRRSALSEPVVCQSADCFEQFPRPSIIDVVSLIVPRRIRGEYRTLITVQPLRVLVFVVVSCMALVHPARSAGLISHTIDSQRLAGNLVGESPIKELLVHLPPGYQESQESYPVVYWFAGAGHRPTLGIDVDALDQEYISGRSAPVITVLMPGLTSFGSSAYLSSAAFGDWEGFLTSEVIPFIDGTYRTSPVPEHRGAMGFSLGGFTAEMLPLLAPNTFGSHRLE